MKTFNWGIIGPGKIAHKFVEGMKSVPGAKLYAVASSSQQRANEFAVQYGATKAYDSYLALVQDPLVDVVYVATTNNFHYNHAKLCLEHKKPCLCEKPFTMNSSQLENLICLAKKNNTFLMEALWTMFLPSISKIDKILANKEIGEIQSLNVDFGFEVPYNEQSRLFSPELGGGALLDIGLYPVFLALHICGEPQNIQASAIKTDLGIDISDSITFEYANGAKAFLQATFAENLPCEATIKGSLGTITMQRMWHCPTKITLEKKGLISDITPEYIGNGYNYEIQEVHKCLTKNQLESNLMPLSFSTQLMKNLDKIYELCS